MYPDEASENDLASALKANKDTAAAAKKAEAEAVAASAACTAALAQSGRFLQRRRRALPSTPSPRPPSPAKAPLDGQPILLDQRVRKFLPGYGTHEGVVTAIDNNICTVTFEDGDVRRFPSEVLEILMD